MLIGSASPSRSSIPVHLARETDRLVHLIIRVDDERDLLQLLPRDGEADGRDLLVLRLDLALEAALQLIGSIDDDLRILVRAVLAPIKTSSASYGFLVLFSMRIDAITVSPLVASAPRSVLAASSATVPAISITNPSSNSATSSSLNCCPFGTSAGVAAVALGAGLGLATDGVGVLSLVVTPDSSWLTGCPPQAARASNTPMSAPESRLIDRHVPGVGITDRYGGRREMEGGPRRRCPRRGRYVVRTP